MILVLKNGKISYSQGSGLAYDGEKQLGDLENWRVLTDDANKILSGTYKDLTQRSATLYHTYGPVKSAINRPTEYGIGAGLVYKSQPDFKTLGWTKDFAVGWGKDFQRIVFYYMKEMNFFQKQSILFRQAMYQGDSGLIFERKKGLLNDLIEIGGDQINCEFENSEYTLGIKHDQWFRRIGIKKTDGTDVSFVDSNGDQNFIQFYFKELARQLRGYPLAYSIINMARNDDTHTDATTHRAVMESLIMATFTQNGTNLNQQIKNLADKNKKVKSQTRAPKNPFSRLFNANKVGPGNVLTMNANEEWKFNDLKTPSNTFGMFKEWMLKYVGMATGTPPEVIAMQYSTSYTAHKGAINDFIKSFMYKRKVFERIVMDKVVMEIAKDAITRGLITAPGFFEGAPMLRWAYTKGMYLGPVPGHINPLVEVKADAEAVNNEFTLRSDIAESYGHDFDIMSEEWAKEQDKFTNSPQSYAEKVTKELKGGADVA
jgi:hypothetical protein